MSAKLSPSDIETSSQWPRWARMEHLIDDTADPAYPNHGEEKVA
jgi:hypothetical protein